MDSHRQRQPQRQILHLRHRTGRDTGRVRQSRRLQRRTRSSRGHERNQPDRLGTRPPTADQQSRRPRHLRDAPPRLLHRPLIRAAAQRQIPRPDRAESHRPPQAVGHQRRAHPPLLRLRVSGRIATRQTTIQLGLRPTELQRAGRKLLLRCLTAHTPHHRIQTNGASTPQSRHTRHTRRSL